MMKTTFAAAVPRWRRVDARTHLSARFCADQHARREGQSGGLDQEHRRVGPRAFPAVWSDGEGLRKQRRRFRVRRW